MIDRPLEAAFPAILTISLLISGWGVIAFIRPLTLITAIGVRATITSFRRISGGRTELASRVRTTVPLRPAVLPVTIRHAILWSPLAARILTARHLEAARCHVAGWLAAHAGPGWFVRPPIRCRRCLAVRRPIFIRRHVAIGRLMTCRRAIAIWHSGRYLRAVTRLPSISAPPNAAIGRTVCASITGRVSRSVVSLVTTASGVVGVGPATVIWPHAARAVPGIRTAAPSAEAALALLVTASTVVAARLDVTVRAVVARGPAVP